MADTPAPYPASTQSKGWRFEVNTEQVKKSETWLRARTGYVRAHLLLLWTEAWEQSPCGSLPADDELIALILGMESGDFAANRAVLMRGWWLAADGRLYHDIIVARVLDMIEKRMSNAERARRSRETKAQSHGANASVTRDAQVTDEHAPREFDTKNQEPRTSTSKEETPKAPRKRRASAAAQQFVSADHLVAEGVAQQHADDWLAIRAKKGLPLTATALSQVRAEAVLAGMSLPQAIKTAAENTWGGFKASWLTEGAPPGGPPRQNINKQEALEASNRAVGDRWLAEQGA